LYFGASNNIGPGSIWRKRPAPQEGYSPRWIIKDAPVNKGSTSNCTGTAAAQAEFGGGATLQNAVTPVTGTLGIEFKRAQKVVLRPTGFRWDDVLEGPYEAYLQKQASGDIKADMTPANMRLVMQRALWVNGLSADLEFDSSTGVDVKGKVKEGPLAVSELGFNANAKWTGNTKLTLTSTEGFYIAGEMVAFSGGFAGPGKVFGQKENVGNAPAVLEPAQ
jgi:hypothetical protein